VHVTPLAIRTDVTPRQATSTADEVVRVQRHNSEAEFVRPVLKLLNVAVRRDVNRLCDGFDPLPVSPLLQIPQYDSHHRPCPLVVFRKATLLLDRPGGDVKRRGEQGHNEQHEGNGYEHLDKSVSAPQLLPSKKSGFHRSTTFTAARC